jgi:hypothetical protein
LHLNFFVKSRAVLQLPTVSPANLLSLSIRHKVAVNKMTATSQPEFNAQTEALEVAAAFPEAIRGKTVVVTGVNPSGIGFATAQALVSPTDD